MYNGTYSASIQDNDESDANDATQRDETRERGLLQGGVIDAGGSSVQSSKSEIPPLSSASLLAPSAAHAAVIRPRIVPGFWATGLMARRQNICECRAQRRRYIGSVETDILTAVMPSSTFPTGLECWVLNGRVQPRRAVAINVQGQLD